MARQQQERLTPKQAALRDLDLARGMLARSTVLVAEEYSPRAMMSRSIERHRVAWIAGAVFAGLVAIKVLLPAGRDAVRGDHGAVPNKTRGLLGLLMVPLMSFGRKAVMNYGSQFVQAWLSGQKPVHAPEPPVV